MRRINNFLKSEKQKSGKRKVKVYNFALCAWCFFCFMLFFCTSNSHKENSSNSTKFQQYYVHGEQLYTKNCSNCHQKDGTGLGLLYPPLNKSDYMDKNFKDVICLMRSGKNGELIVNGKNYNQPMPGISELTDLEIAEIATYIYNNWQHQRGLVSVQEVAAIQVLCDSINDKE